MSVAYVDPMLPRLSDEQLRLLIQQAAELLGYRRAFRRADTIEDIAWRVAGEHGLALEDLAGVGRLAPVVRARHQAFSEIHATGRYSLHRIGKFFGGRDHTTVLLGIRAHEARMAAEREGAAA